MSRRKKSRPSSPAPATPAGESREQAMSRWTDLAAGLALTAFVVVLHVILMLNAGPMWRDEVNTVNLSTPGMASLGDFNGRDSFPILWFLLLRGWITLVGPMNDLALRVLGMIVGLAIIAAVWLIGRRMGRFVPFWTMALFVMNPGFLRWDDSMRAYGLGVLMLMLVIWSFWELVQQPSLKRFIVAAVIGVLAVQSVFYNSFLLLAVAVAAAAVAARNGLWKRAVLPLAAGAPAALSLVFYVPMIMSMGEWNVLVKWPFTMRVLWIKLTSSLAAGLPTMSTVWLVAFGLAIAVAIIVQLKPLLSRHIAPDRRDMALFALIAMVLGTAVHIAFLRWLSYLTETWYYIPVAALAAICIDIILAVVTPGLLTRTIRLVIVAVIVLACAGNAWTSVHERQTTVDLLAKEIEQKASPQDLVVFVPWNTAVTFSRYYDGQTPWVTVPPIGQPTLHRFDLIRAFMEKPNEAITPVLDQVTETLRGGHKVWVIGGIVTAPQGARLAPPRKMSPPPLPDFKWHEYPYDRFWAYQLGYLLQEHEGQRTLVPTGLNLPTNMHERPPLFMISGWHPGRSSPAPSQPTPPPTPAPRTTP